MKMVPQTLSTNLNEIKLEPGQVWQAPFTAYLITWIDNIVCVDPELDSMIFVREIKISDSGEIIYSNWTGRTTRRSFIYDLKHFGFHLCVPCVDCHKFCGQACQRRL